MLSKNNMVDRDYNNRKGFAFIFLHEKFTAKSAVGAALITVGTLIMVL